MHKRKNNKVSLNTFANSSIHTNPDPLYGIHRQSCTETSRTWQRSRAQQRRGHRGRDATPMQTHRINDRGNDE